MVRTDTRAGGFALMVVIIILLIVSFLASQLILQVQTEQKIAFNVKKKAAARFLAEAGFQMALLRILEPKTIVEEGEEAVIKFQGGKIYDTFFNQGKISYSAVNESGKIDLNRAPRQLFELFFEYHGVEPEATATIIDSLMDWRDGDDLLRLNGAEKNYYEDLEDPYMPRNGEIQDPAELALVQGADALAEKFVLEDVFTVNNTDAKINFSNLTQDMLDFLTEGDKDRQSAYREIMESGEHLAEAEARLILGDERFERLQAYLTYSSTNKFYMVTSTGYADMEEDSAELDQKEEDMEVHPPGIRMQVLLHVKGDIDYEILSWRENHA